MADEKKCEKLFRFQDDTFPDYCPSPLDRKVEAAINLLIFFSIQGVSVAILKYLDCYSMVLLVGELDYDSKFASLVHPEVVQYLKKFIPLRGCVNGLKAIQQKHKQVRWVFHEVWDYMSTVDKRVSQLNCFRWNNGSFTGQGNPLGALQRCVDPSLFRRGELKCFFTFKPDLVIALKWIVNHILQVVKLNPVEVMKFQAIENYFDLYEREERVWISSECTYPNTWWGMSKRWNRDAVGAVHFPEEMQDRFRYGYMGPILEQIDPFDGEFLTQIFDVNMVQYDTEDEKDSEDSDCDVFVMSF